VVGHAADGLTVAGVQGHVFCGCLCSFSLSGTFLVFACLMVYAFIGLVVLMPKATKTTNVQTKT